MSPSHGTARRALCGAILSSVLVLLGACGSSGISGPGGSAATSGSPSALQPRTIVIGANPQTAALDPATHTLYADDAPENFTDGEVSVINASTCNALQASGCGITTPEVQVGYRPGTIAVDQATDTIYVVNSGDNTVSVINGATCNTQDTSGCSHRPPTVRVGSNPVDLSLDQATDTVYVANWGNGSGTTVSVIDGRTCNGQVTSGCGQIPATVRIGTAPGGVVVDEPAGTVYAATVAPSGAEAVWVINGATCNATTTSGCGQKPASVTVGAGSANYNVAFAIDQATQTLYVANWRDNTLSVIDTATCNATTTSGCAQTPHAAQVGSGPDGIAIDLATDTLYVSNVTGDTVSVLDAATCNATVSSGCATQRSRSLRTGQSPQWVTVDQATDTLYVPNGDAGNMSVLNGATCNASVTSACN
jgi:YVTN family beta-propeller protein